MSVVLAGVPSSTHTQFGSPSSSPLVLPSSSVSALQKSSVHLCMKTKSFWFVFNCMSDADSYSGKISVPQGILCSLSRNYSTVAKMGYVSR